MRAGRELARGLLSLPVSRSPHESETMTQARFATVHNQAPVATAMRQASAKTGTQFGYLMRTAMRESSMDPNAKASSSSATGLFQFVDRTWIGMMKNHGAEHGLGRYADAIQTDARGRQYVPDAKMRQEILALRKDPKVASLMAAELTEENRQTLHARLGRSVSDGELYAAHFMGADSASRLIRHAEQDPDATAASLFPAAARANRSIFYDHGGQARTVAQVYAKLTGEAAGDAAPTAYAANLPTDGVTMSSARTRLASAAGAGAGGSAARGGMPTHQSLMLSPRVIALLSSLDPIPGGFKPARSGDDDKGRANALDAVA